MAKAVYLPYAATHRFAPLVLDYLAGKSALADLYTYRPDAAGIEQAIEARKQFPVDRRALIEVLNDQYADLPVEACVQQAISSLSDERTFTVCTAHQPNLATGYLYFAYKIIHAIRLARDLSAAHPGYNFVPIYYMGSEDADLDELGTFRFGGKKFVWDAEGQTGAVGRMSTRSLEPLLQELFQLLGPPGEHAKTLEQTLRDAYLKHANIADATQYLVHSLFGRFGLVVLNPDDQRLKKNFVSVMEDDLLARTATQAVGETIQNLEAAGYKAQAHPRPINLFYLDGSIRERIERDGYDWKVLNTAIRWSREELLQLLHTHPERFSPNVMLRPLYQETILPDVAFIGGGAEVSYWLQLKTLFAHHKVFFPAIMLRQSVAWMSARQQEIFAKTGLNYSQLFLAKDEAAKEYASAQAGDALSLDEERDHLEVLLSSIRQKATALDPTLTRSADAVLARMNHQLDALRGKMLRAVKRKETVALNRIGNLQEQLFPGGGLAERVENFMPYYLEYGPEFFDELMRFMDPLRNEFLLVEEGA